MKITNENQLSDSNFIVIQKMNNENNPKKIPNKIPRMWKRKWQRKIKLFHAKNNVFPRCFKIPKDGLEKMKNKIGPKNGEENEREKPKLKRKSHNGAWNRMEK